MCIRDRCKEIGIRVSDGGWHFGYMGGHGEKNAKKRVCLLYTSVPKESLTRYDEKELRFFQGTSRHDMEHGCYGAGEDPALHSIPDDTLIYGNMQDEGYFGKYREQIRQWLKVRPEYDSHEFTRDNLCIINYRGGEYTGHPELYLDRSYWMNGMKNMRKIRPDMEFIIVTDDPEAARKLLPGLPVYHSDLDRDYVMIKNARYLLLSNSTFAFFPAYTSETLRAAIAPKYWARHNLSDEMCIRARGSTVRGRRGRAVRRLQHLRLV